MKPLRRQLALVALAVALFAVLGLPQAPPAAPEVVAAAAPRIPAARAGGGAATLLPLEPRAFEPSEALFPLPRPPKPTPQAIAAAKRAQAIAVEPPQPPPVPFRYLGVVMRDGQATALLRMNERDFVVQAGETLENAYRVKSIDAGAVQLTYLPLDTQQTVLLYEPRPVNLSEAAQ